MSTRSLQDQVDALLSKKVVQPKIVGTTSSDVETASVLESLAISALLNPKTALYTHYLAKSGLLAAIDSEIAAIDGLMSAISDLGNITYAVKDLKSLQRAQNSVIQLSTQGQVSSSSGAFKRFSSSVDDFLDKQLGKNIKRPGSTEMVRPGEEAGLDLPPSLTTLKDRHADFLDRIYALSVGVPNFLSTPFSSIVGANAVFRTKKDIDSLLADFQADDSGAQSRDAAVRLLSDRATLKLVGASIDISSEVVDTVKGLPAGQPVLTGKSANSSAVATTSVAAPFILATGGSLTINSTTSTALNQALNKAAILGSAVIFPVSVPANFHLFLKMEAVSGLTWIGPNKDGSWTETADLGAGWFLTDGVYMKTFKATLNSGSPVTTPPGSAVPLSMTLSGVVSAINSSLGTPANPAVLGSAVEFVGAGTNRLLIVASNPKINKIAVHRLAAVLEPLSDGVMGSVGATAVDMRTYTNSFHENLGFNTEKGTAGNTPTSRLVEALRIAFQLVATFTPNPDDSITVTSIASAPGTVLQFSGTWSGNLGLTTSYAVSPSVSLQASTGLISPVGVVDTGDVLFSATGSSVISAVSIEDMTLASELRTFNGDVFVVSALYLVWQEIENSVSDFLKTWLVGSYASDLSSLDKLIAVLIGSPTSPRRSEALDLLVDLKSQIQSLKTTLSTTAATLPTGSGSKEKVLVDGVIQTFIERKFDRALDLLLRCKIQEIFELDWQTVSYSGNLMKAASSIARSDVSFPDNTKDEGYDTVGLRDRDV